MIIRSKPTRKKECCRFTRASSQYVEVGNVAATSFERTNSFSLVCWFKTTFSNGSIAFVELLSKTSASINSLRGYDVRINHLGQLGFRLDNTVITNGLSCDFIGTFNDNIWHQAVITYNGSSDITGLLGYVDGVNLSKDGSVNALTGTTVTTAPFRIGAHSSNFMDGKIDEAAVYNKTLSAGEVTTIWNNGSVANLTVVGPTANLVGYWRMGEGASFPTIPDISVSGNNGTMTNMLRSDITSRRRIFHPPLISDCIAWFDMQDASSYTNSGGFVSSITNKMSNVAWTEATNRPAYSATGLNGFPCMDFDGINDQITSNESAVVTSINNNTGYTIFYVAKHDTIATSNVVFGAANSAEVSTQNTKSWGVVSTGNWRSQGRTSAGVTVAVSSAGAADTSNHVFTWRNDGSLTSLAVDIATEDPSGVSNNTGVINTNLVSIGSLPAVTPTFFMDGKVGEIIYYNRQLTKIEREEVCNYLRDRWNFI